MRLSSIALAALAILLLGTPARADQVVFVANSPSLDSGLSDEGDMDVGAFGFTLVGAPAPALGLGDSPFETTAPFSTAGIALQFGEGLENGHLLIMTAAAAGAGAGDGESDPVGETLRTP